MALQRRAARQQGPWDPDARTRQAAVEAVGQDEPARIGRTHARAAAVRRDVLHKATTALAQQHQVITVETLNASGMRSAGGARKRGLNRALADAALAEVRRMLGYKCTWYGSTLVEAGPVTTHPSKTLFGLRQAKAKPDAGRPDLSSATTAAWSSTVTSTPRSTSPDSANPALGEQSPAGSGPVAGRGATRETEPARAGDAGGREASTPHRRSRWMRRGPPHRKARLPNEPAESRLLIRRQRCQWAAAA